MFEDIVALVAFVGCFVDSYDDLTTIEVNDEFLGQGYITWRTQNGRWHYHTI